MQPGFPSRVAEVVESAEARVRWVALTVEVAEQERRILEPSRREFHKLADLAVLRGLRTEPPGERPPADLVRVAATAADTRGQRRRGRRRLRLSA